MSKEVDERVEYFRTIWPNSRERVDAFLEQCTCMNEEDKSVLSVLLDDLSDPEGIRFYRCPEGGTHEPTEKLSATICSKCRIVLKSNPPIKLNLVVE